MKQIENILKETLEQVTEFRSNYLSNEQAVRTQLIEPILNALGWKTHNPNFVRPNAPGEDGKIPDYTLLKDKKETLIVEAKNLSIDLQTKSIIDQLAAYCYNRGILFGVLTNGVKWLLFKTFEKNPKERIVWEVNLQTDNLEYVSRNLFSFAYENIDFLDNLLNTSKTLEKNWTELYISTDSVLKIISQKLLDKIKSTEPTFNIDSNDLKTFTKGKIVGMFKKTEIEEEEEEEESTSEKTENEFAEVKNVIFKKEQTINKREKISVTFPDGTVINCKKVVDTFLEAIKRISPERVLPLNVIRDKVNIVSDREVNDRYKNVGKYWVNGHSSTKDKINMLNEINKKLNLNLKIETSFE